MFASLGYRIKAFQGPSLNGEIMRTPLSWTSKVLGTVFGPVFAVVALLAQFENAG